MRAAIYVRLSVHRGEADPSLSPQRQEEVCRAYCLAKGWDVGEVVRDLDVSGSDKGLRLDRPGLHELRSMFGRIDVIVFAKLDRLARNVIDFRAFNEEASAQGVALVSVAESLDLSSPTGRFVATILAAFAEMEAATIAERVRGGIDSVRRSGRFSGGVVPYGYRTADNPSGAGKVLVVDADEAQVVREILDRILAGEKTGHVARDLNSRGVQARYGEWTDVSLRSMLRADTLLGYQRHRGQLLVDERGIPLQVWEPHTTPDEIARARQLIASTPHAQVGRRPASDALLAGLLVCSSCGSRLSVKTPGKGQPSHYGCTTRSRGRLCEKPVSVRMPEADEAVTNAYLSAFGWLPEVIRELVPGAGADLVRVVDALAAITEAMREPGADIAALAEQAQALSAERDRLATDDREREVITQTGQRIRDAWTGYSVRLRRELIGEALAEPIVVGRAQRRGRFDKERLAIVWREDDVIDLDTD
jgi:site-specific DNA recombinase